jgi:hypothetical protein
MACRTPSKADAARKEILETLAAIELSEPSSSSSSDPDTEAKTETSKETSSAKAKSKAEDRLYTLPLDLNSFKSVRVNLWVSMLHDSCMNGWLAILSKKGMGYSVELITF